MYVYIGVGDVWLTGRNLCQPVEILCCRLYRDYIAVLRGHENISLARIF